jgi:protein TonB
MSISVLLHLLLLVGFSFMTVKAAEEEPPGFIEVEFGAFEEGRPVQRAPVRQEVVKEEQRDPDPVPQPEPPKVAPPKESKPVDLPDLPQEAPDEEQVETPEAETISPETQNNEAPVEATKPEPKPEEVKPLGGGDPEGDGGETSGDNGDGATERRRAPFNIEGLNRVPVTTPLPAYNAQVNAVISVRITVDPQGRIVTSFPLVKGNPQLETAVLDALRRWKFNPLPPNAPQENQTGTITFRFQLE